MNKDKWIELKVKIEQKFGSFTEEKHKEELEDDLGNAIPQVVESLIFESPMGEIKLERTSHPRIIEKRPHYHKGSGGAKLEFVIDEDEETSHLTVYKKEDDEWVKLDLPPEKISF